MIRTIAILGRQPAIGRAELESLYGSDALGTLNAIAVGLSVDPDFKRLGGTVKLAQYVTRLKTDDWEKIQIALRKIILEQEVSIPEGKLTLGISAYGLKINPKTIGRTCLELKKALRQTGRSVRVVPNKSNELSSAQVLHNKLAGSNGRELVLVRDGTDTLVGITTHIQDIEAYAARDQARPARDARVGMLPPKLAQTLINLCNPAPEATVLDPFCGTGVVLQEASLMGLKVYGTDLEPRMIDYSDENLTWLEQTHKVQIVKQLEVADATTHKWQHAFDSIAGETYLGRPFTHEPDQGTLNQVMQDVDTIHRKFLENVAQQTKPGFRMCIAVPAWHVKGRVRHLKTLDSLEELGYTRQSFAHASNKELIYHREGQVVGRELVVLRRK